MLKHSRRLFFVAPCVALVAGLWLLPAFAQLPGEQAQNADSMPQSHQMAVPFSHDAHNKKAKLKNCGVCHHPLPGPRGKLVKGPERRCSDCHSQRPGPSDMTSSLMTASHKMCQGCHTAKKKGPVKCSGCHKHEPKPQESNIGEGGGFSGFGSFMSPAVPGIPAPQAEPATPGAPKAEGGQ